MQKTAKCLIAEVLKSFVTPVNTGQLQNSVHVPDGGQLLNLVPWIFGCRHIDITNEYVSFVANNYWSIAVVCFDRYPDALCLQLHLK